MSNKMSESEHKRTKGLPDMKGKEKCEKNSELTLEFKKNNFATRLVETLALEDPFESEIPGTRDCD